MQHFNCTPLVFFRQWGWLVMRDLIKHDALLWLVVFFLTALIGAFRSLLFHTVICSLGGPLSHNSPVVVFFDCGHPHFWNFYSTILVDVVRVKSYMNCLFEPAHVVIRVMINKLYLYFQSGLCLVLWASHMTTLWDKWKT